MARRVNTRFLIILTLVVGGLMIGLFVAQRVLTRKDPEQLARSAEEKIAAGNLQSAAYDLGGAINAKPGDPALRVRLGDLYVMMKEQDGDWWRKALGQWQAALQADPAHVPALERLLLVYKQEAKRSPGRSEPFTQLQEFAGRLAKAQPDNYAAAGLQQRAVIEAAVNGHVVPPENVDAAMETLTELIEKDPGSSEHPYWLARAILHQARDASPARRKEAREEAEKMMADAVARQPDDASMHWRMGSLLQYAVRTTPAAKRGDLDAAKARIGEFMMKARDLAQPDHPEYTEIMTTAARLALPDDVEGMKATMQALADARPWDMGVRLEQARLLGLIGEVEEGIRVLEAPAPAREGIDWDNLLMDHEIARQSGLLGLKIRRLSTIGDMAQRKQEAAKIEQERLELARRIGEPPLLKMLEGELHMALGEWAEAVEAFEQARAALRGGEVNAELSIKLAGAYARLGQMGSAKELWTEVLRAYPQHAPARVALAEALLRENDMEGAQRQLQALEQLDVPAESLATLRAMIVGGGNDATASVEALAALPEETHEDARRKAAVALRMGEREEAVRLLEKVYKLNPSPQAAQDLAQQYLLDNQRDKAQALLEEAIETVPGGSALTILLGQVNTSSREELDAFLREQMAKTEDPFQREVQLFQLAARNGRSEDAVGHLQNAEKLQPDNLWVKEQLLSVALQQGDWETAGRYVDDLAAADADQANGAVFRFQLARARGDVEQAAEHALEASRKLTHFARGSLVLAQARHAQGRLEEAVTLYRAALDKQSNNAEALRGLLACQLALNNVTAAEATIREAMRVLPRDPYFAEAWREHRQRYGNPASVLEERKEIAAKNPEDPRAVAQLGRTYQQAAMYAQQRGDERRRNEYLAAALKTYQDAAAKWPDEHGFVGATADVQLAAGDPAGAEKTLRDLAEREGWQERPEPHTMLAQLMLQQGRIPDAEGQLREALIKSKGDLELRLRLVDFLGQTGRLDLALEELSHADRAHPLVQRKRVELLLAGGAVEEAEKELKEAIAVNPDSPDLKSMLAHLYVATNRAPEALETVNQVLSAHPDNLPALLRRGQIRLVQGSVDEAIADLTRVTSAQSTNVEAQVTLASAQRLKRNTAGAIQAMEAALKVQPVNKTLRMQLLSLLTEADPPRWTEAERFLRDTRQMPQFEKDAEWALAEANMWQRRGQGPRALASIQEALQLSPGNPTLIDTYLKILLSSGDQNAVAMVLQQTEEMVKGENPPWWALHARARAFKAQGDKGEALAAYERALATEEAKQNPQIAQELVTSLGREIGVEEAVRRMGDRLKTDISWKLLAVQLYQSSGESSAAISLLEEIEAEKSQLNVPQRRQYLQLAGLIYSSAKPLPNPSKAYQAYLELLEMDSNDMQALNNVACLLVDVMRPADPVTALGFSQRAMDLMMQQGRLEPLIQDTHGWVLTHLPNRRSQGISLLQEVVASRPSFPDVYFHLGDAYLRDDQPQRAVPHLEEAISMIAEKEKKQDPVDLDMKVRAEQALSQAQSRVKAAAE